MNHFKMHLLWLAPVLGALLAYVMGAYGWQTPACLTAGLTLVCGLWWIFEPIPIPITSLIPLGIFPLLGILNGEQVAQAYGSPLILLLAGGAMLSKAMEKSGAHQRLAMAMVRLCGGSSYRRLVFGFMLASAFLSMWISNTATVLMLLPVALAVIERAHDKQFSIPLLLGIAYAGSIGGLGTPIGTPPNVIFLQVYADSTGETISFLGWMMKALPVVVVLLPLAAWWLTRNLSAGAELTLPQPTQWRTSEKRVLWVFGLTALAWMTLTEPSGGWKAWLDLPTANYAAVAFTAVIALAMLPDGEGGRLLDWEHASKIHWGVLILFAGGIALASAFTATGLSAAIGAKLGALAHIPVWLLVLCVALTVTFLTEITSNTATATLLMPILAAAAIGANIDPLLLMLPAALSASCAFMLPVATAPNAIVFGTGEFTVARMAREGFVINLMGAAAITAVLVAMQ
ncbi:SLC13 family permease [Simiduia aestuariiviva]|uniref:Sodium-dependent dicarboxylate transporter 2/3/5 n=1 Tax=Simiduia aestuariiviva TaxID=1510459 RepID=A0A839UNC6_9GAMM|nr:SLC13 family permease [Simiduia aestuariiviva]MBB3169233.1 sodium-dependent dicarboxylate transporter 2/3/5 [Simiduia aestuariiviva]